MTYSVGAQGNNTLHPAVQFDYKAYFSPTGDECTSCAQGMPAYTVCSHVSRCQACIDTLMGAIFSGLSENQPADSIRRLMGYERWDELLCGCQPPLEGFLYGIFEPKISEKRFVNCFKNAQGTFTIFCPVDGLPTAVKGQGMGPCITCQKPSPEIRYFLCSTHAACPECLSKVLIPTLMGVRLQVNNELTHCTLTLPCCNLCRGSDVLAMLGLAVFHNEKLLETELISAAPARAEPMHVENTLAAQPLPQLAAPAQPAGPTSYKIGDIITVPVSFGTVFIHPLEPATLQVRFQSEEVKVVFFQGINTSAVMANLRAQKSAVYNVQAQIKEIDDTDNPVDLYCSSSGFPTKIVCARHQPIDIVIGFCEQEFKLPACHLNTKDIVRLHTATWTLNEAVTCYLWSETLDVYERQPFLDCWRYSKGAPMACTVSEIHTSHVVAIEAKYQEIVEVRYAPANTRVGDVIQVKVDHAQQYDPVEHSVYSPWNRGNAARTHSRYFASLIPLQR